MSSKEQNPILERYRPAIGLEVHCQLKTKSKLFCSCSTEFGARPNENICPVCSGAPGVLPVLNSQAVEFAIKMALAVEGKIQGTSVFARKQYFYPDLPKGYQITQFNKPYCKGGGIILSCGKKILLERIHIEEDAGKSIHSKQSSFIDLNRAGIALLEIVSTPTIETPFQASQYLKKLRTIVRYLDISDGNLEEGSFRCDANISLQYKNKKGLGTRCEIKNLNSFRNVEKAISYEIMRHADLLDSGEKVTQATLLWDAAAGRTRQMRSKEFSDDYRYFPDPDLLPLVLSSSRIEHIKKTIPELPDNKINRFIKSYKIPFDEAVILTSEVDLSVFYEKIVYALEGKLAANKVAHWFCGEFLKAAKEHHWSWKNVPVPVQNFIKLLTMVGEDKVSVLAAKQVFKFMVEKNKDPYEIAKDIGVLQVSDMSQITKTIEEVLILNPNQVNEYLQGKDKVYGFFFGKVMRKGNGSFNPKVVERLLKDQLTKAKEDKK